MKCRYAIQSRCDWFTHNVGDVDTLGEIVFGLTSDLKLAARISKIASLLEIGDDFAMNGIRVRCEEDK